MNQSDRQKIQQNRCMFQADLTSSFPNIHYKRFKFDLIFNKSVRNQLREEVKDNILESLVFKCKIDEILIYHMASRATYFFKFLIKN